MNIPAPDGLHTLGRWTTDRARSAPERTAIDDRGVALTYRELEARAAALTDAFKDAGYGPGQRIATLTGNSSDHVVLFFACAKAGLTLVPLSWRLAPAELAEQLRIAAPALFVVEPEHGALGAAAMALLPLPPASAEPGRDGIERGLPRLGEAAARRTVADDDPLLAVFTSGTSGRPKAAVLTHANCFWTNLSFSRTVEVGRDDVVLCVMPQFHVGGWNIQALLAWWTGATVVLERGFDAGRVLKLIAQRRVTTMMGVPAHYLLLSQHPGFGDADLSSLRRAVVGGAPMAAPLLRTWHARGVALTQGYGLTEAGPNVLCLAPEEALRRVGSAGTPYPHVDVAVADPAMGQEVHGAGRGELWVRGPGVFAGYLDDPAATAQVLVDGWLHTGDVVERDADGFLGVVDRLKDIYISGGENVSPSEVEQALLSHPAVADAAVVGVPDPRWGEAGAAFVVMRHGAATDEEELTEHLRSVLAHFKVPRSIEFVEDIPRTGLHKIARSRLRPGPEAGACTALPGEGR
ncbi:long-chain fatty acid--CoA ligase [Sinomonas notoginsengisoli]|uniref:AMP-binding protein n=1 Tax=Sinomonas notoginsengisoli TaxID=1457311 RepID=UPI001F2D4758|nr:AMP-binding protein [Sinomonas notoginsengisoli]